MTNFRAVHVQFEKGSSAIGCIFLLFRPMRIVVVTWMLRIAPFEVRNLSMVLFSGFFHLCFDLWGFLNLFCVFSSLSDRVRIRPNEFGRVSVALCWQRVDLEPLVASTEL